MADMEKKVMVRLYDVFELCIEGNFIAEIMYVYAMEGKYVLLCFIMVEFYKIIGIIMA